MSDDHDGTQLTRRRLLGGVVTMGTAAAIGGVGTIARFHDEESSTVSVQAGTLDLQLSDSDEGFDEDSDSVTSEFTNVKPGEKFSDDITLRNIGSVEADHVELGFSYDEIESSGPNGNDGGDTKPGSAEGMAKQFEVLELEYGDQYLLSNLVDANRNGRIDIDDLSSRANDSVLDDLSPPPAAKGGTRTFSARFQFVHDSENNDYQGDDLMVTITFALHQNSSQNI